MAWRRYLFALLLLLISPAGASGQELSGKALVEALRTGGYTIYFRHAATEWDQTDRIGAPGEWRSCDPGAMRQLSDAGRTAARRVGTAIRELRVPVGKVLSSEYCRTTETARLLGIGDVEPTPDIMNMLAAGYVGGRDAVIGRAREILSRPPAQGANAVIVAHGNLMQAATGEYTSEMGAGIYSSDPAAATGVVLVGRLLPDDWVWLAEQFGGS